MQTIVLLLDSAGLLCGAVFGLAVMVLGFTKGRQLFRKMDAGGGSGEPRYGDKREPEQGYVVRADGGGWESSEKAYRRYLWNNENNVGGYHKTTGKRIR